MLIRLSKQEITILVWRLLGVVCLCLSAQVVLAHTDAPALASDIDSHGIEHQQPVVDMLTQPLHAGQCLSSNDGLCHLSVSDNCCSGMPICCIENTAANLYQADKAVYFYLGPPINTPNLPREIRPPIIA